MPDSSTKRFRQDRLAQLSLGSSSKPPELDGRTLPWIAVHASTRSFLPALPRDTTPVSSGFSLQDISCTFFAAMCVSLVSVGHLVASLKGLPIGGLLSRAATSAYLASKEHAWLSSSSVRLEAGFHSIAGFWRNTMLHLRYVDDVLLASRALCRQCLLQVFPLVYSEVSFKVAPPGLSQIWLDMHIVCITGDVFPKPRKPCTPPPWGTSRAYIRPLILGAMLRATAVSTSDSAVRIFMLQFLIGLRQSGWSKRQVCRALYTIHKDHLRSLLVFLRKSVRSEDFSEAVLRQ